MEKRIRRRGTWGLIISVLAGAAHIVLPAIGIDVNVVSTALVGAGGSLAFIVEKLTDGKVKAAELNQYVGQFVEDLDEPIEEEEEVDKEHEVEVPIEEQQMPAISSEVLKAIEIVVERALQNK